MHLSPLDTHAGLLIRTWTRYSEPGQPRPHAEQAAHVRNRGHSRTPDPLHHTWTRYIARGPAIPNLGNPAHMQNRRPTCGTGGTAVHQTRYIARGPAIPSLGNPAHVRNMGFTRGTAAGGPAWGHPYYMPARRSPALCVSVAGRRRSLRGSCPWRGRRGLPQVPRRRCPRASRPKR